MEDKSMKGTLQALAVKQALHYIEHEPIKNLPRLLHWVDTFDKEDRFLSQRTIFHHILDHPEGNWYQLILRFFQLDKGVRKAFLENFIIHATLTGSPRQEEVRQREGCNVPWAILLDPTSACNLHCTGCWAAEYGPKMRLDLGTMDSIIRQGKALGTHMYIYTGGEPLVCKGELMTLCWRHPDCEFLAFTNGTLIDEAFCQEMLQVKNFVPAISLEGFSAGDVEPCVFIHYSNVNIHTHTLLEALKSPLFLAYHHGQPFNDNMLRPCPMLENPACLREMVTRSGAKSTDLQSTETVDQLCGKCQTYAQEWAGTAEQLWRESRCAEG